MQLACSRIWTRVAESISYNDNHYTTGTSTGNFLFIVVLFVLILSALLLAVRISLSLLL